MILSNEILNRIDFYEAERFSKGMYSRITLYWKRAWWQFWITPKIISIKCIPRDGGYVADNEWNELSEQLRNHFLALSKGKSESAKLFLINGGKEDNT